MMKTATTNRRDLMIRIAALLALVLLVAAVAVAIIALQDSLPAHSTTAASVSSHLARRA